MMATDSQPAPASKAMFWTGWIVSILPVLMLVMSGAMKFLQPPDAVEGFAHLGWPLQLAVALGMIELGATLLYLVPQTAVLGAILLTGYLGGAIATHVRIGEHGQIVIPVVMGVLIWLGLYLRDARLRSLIPLRS
jgi:DoxX-like family